MTTRQIVTVAGITITAGLAAFLLTLETGNDARVGGEPVVTCLPAIAECPGRVMDSCLDEEAPTARDAGALRERYVTLRLRASVCTDGTARITLPDEACWTPLDLRSNCIFDAACNDPELCGDGGVTLDAGRSRDGGEPSSLRRTGRRAASRCACRRPGRACNLQLADGGVGAALELNTVRPGPFVGTGCVPAPCSELDGEQGRTFPELCR